jgi:hypothetical protein
MKLLKRNATFVHELPFDPEMKGACLLLPSTLHSVPEQDQLPRALLPVLPAVILCRACDAFLERLLNQRGVAVTAPRDPVDAVPDGAEVHVDLIAGVLTEVATSRRYALKPLSPEHVQEIRENV